MHPGGDRRSEFRTDSDYNPQKYIISSTLFIKYVFLSILIGVAVGVNNEVAVVVCDVVVVVVAVKQIIQ